MRLSALYFALLATLVVVRGGEGGGGEGGSASSSPPTCACGYTINNNDDDDNDDNSNDHASFTEALETDFLHTHDLARDTNAAWVPQAYAVTPEHADGPYGKVCQVENVVTNPVARGRFDWAGPGVHRNNDGDDEDPGLQLWARSELVPVSSTAAGGRGGGEGGEGGGGGGGGGEEEEEGGLLVPMSEIVSARNDILYGSFRIGMKTSRVPGTCAAFFYYLNDSHEIDLEFLSKQTSAQGQSVIHLVLQPPLFPITAAAAAVNSPSPGPSSATRTLTFAAQEGYHDYRFDWLPDRVDFYADAVLLASLRENVPGQGGRLHVSHWSNGNEGWSGGPPGEDAVLTVSYVKAYFNSSDAGRREAVVGACAASFLQQQQQQQQRCRVPDQTVPPDPAGVNGNETGRTVFLTPQTVGESTGSEPKESGGGGYSKGLPEAWWTAFVFMTVGRLLLLDRNNT